MEFMYKNQFTQIDDVKLLLIDENENKNYIAMEYEKKDNNWYCITNKKVARYKFVVGQRVRLNDPDALNYVQDEYGEIWSVPKTDPCQKPDNISVNRYVITNVDISKGKHITNRSEFIYNEPLNLCFGVYLSGVKGMHSVTYVCHQPDGRIYYLEEKAITVSENNTYNVDIIFKNRIAEIQPMYAVGVWQTEVFLDGNAVIKDYFTLKKNVKENLLVIDYKL